MDTTIDYVLFIRDYDGALALDERRTRNKAAFDEVLPRLEYLGLHTTRLDETYGAIFMTDSRKTLERIFQVKFACQTRKEQQTEDLPLQGWKALSMPVIPPVLNDFIAHVSFPSNDQVDFNA
jgi:hypothetical protein